MLSDFDAMAEPPANSQRPPQAVGAMGAGFQLTQSSEAAARGDQCLYLCYL